MGGGDGDGRLSGAILSVVGHSQVPLSTMRKQTGDLCD